LFLGNIETKSESASVVSRNVAIRNELDLFVNILHCKSYAGVPARQKDIDIVIIRQNTEGEYAMLEHEVRLSNHGLIHRSGNSSGGGSPLIEVTFHSPR
jgi:isocitrate/isopropylmalate dehydrogenase